MRNAFPPTTKVVGFHACDYFMKEKRKFIVWWIALGILAVALIIRIAIWFASQDDAQFRSGYGASSVMTNASSAEMMDMAAEDADYAYEESSASGIEVNTDAIERGEKLVYNASVSLQTKEYARDKKAVLDVIRQYSAIIESTSESDSSGRYSDTGMTIYWQIRVPYESFNDVYDALTSEDGWSVVSASANVSNLTERYSMNASYIEAYQIEKETLLKLLEQATRISDILEINDRLASVNSELKYYTDSNRSIDKDVEYSTISVSLSEVRKYASEKVKFKTRFGEAVQDAGRLFVAFIEGIVLFITRYSLFLVLIAGIGVVVGIIVKRKRKKKGLTVK